MSFKEEVNDAILQVTSITALIQQSRPIRPGAKFDEEIEKKKQDKIAEARKNLQAGFSPERIESLLELSQKSMPMEVDEIIHKLERMEFLLEDVRKGKDRKNNLKSLIDSFKTTPLLQNALLAIPSLLKIANEP